MPDASGSRIDWDAFRRLMIDARQDAGLSQAELARLVGWPPGIVAGFEAGDCVPTPDVAARMVRVVCTD